MCGSNWSPAPLLMVTGVNTGVTPWSGTTTVCVAAGVHVVMATKRSDMAPVNAFCQELVFFMLFSASQLRFDRPSRPTHAQNTAGPGRLKGNLLDSSDRARR